ncbi:MBOAT family O-acyltransferase [Brevibacillus fortis]|uniref:MBOAT family O-acyltransferase n=1 Tax=Brevibacillus fortis TaxID=2126352 RepID=UPI002E22AE24|nr:MBOAT family O-acyltransferase [Brevibacillus fortis]
MVFSSLIFLYYFLPITILLYFIVPTILKNVVLFAASLVFYAWGEPVYIFLMLFSTVFDYANARLIDKFRHRKGIARTVFITSLTGSLGILGFFKYGGFVMDNLNHWFGLNVQMADLPLPVGISFYTFQTISYMVDVYRDRVPVQKNMLSFGLYVMMFPQLVAGPIVKYGDIAHQLSYRKVTLERFGEGAELFIRGLAKKVLLANNIGTLWTSVKAMPADEISVLSAWIGIIAFSFQIYFDFSGYSDMARGLGKMFGFDLMENFKYPYISKSITEFWRRWHISLGTWFREYVYIPLGGNRAGIMRQFINLLVVWFLTGLWHGASWNFVIWGLYFGLFIMMEKWFLLRWLQNSHAFVGHIYTILIVIVGWVFFEMKEISDAWTFIYTMFGFGSHNVTDTQSLYFLSTHWLLLLLMTACATPFAKQAVSYVRDKFHLAGNAAAVAMYVFLLLLSTAFLVNETYNPFLYFRF